MFWQFEWRDGSIEIKILHDIEGFFPQKCSTRWKLKKDFTKYQKSAIFKYSEGAARSYRGFSAKSPFWNADEIISQKFCSLRTSKFRICNELKGKKKKKWVWEKELAPWAKLCPNQQKEACVGISIPTQEFLTLKPVYTGLHHSPICTSLEFSFPATFMVLLDGWITHSACTHFSNCIQRLSARNNYGQVSSFGGSCRPWMFWSRFAFLFQLWNFHGLILRRFWGLLVPGERTGSSQHSLVTSRPGRMSV